MIIESIFIKLDHQIIKIDRVYILLKYKIKIYLSSMGNSKVLGISC
ncbi:hypothetical protein GM3709_3661 [Geminocystis sp. NIES-3709]|nr:hypothetical protein GM3709_3661 [Geminocystis sp. NIES-3709]